MSDKYESCVYHYDINMTRMFGLPFAVKGHCLEKGLSSDKIAVWIAELSQSFISEKEPAPLE